MPFADGADLTGLAQIAAATLILILGGRLLTRGRAGPGIQFLAGWGALSLLLTFWGVATPLSLRIPAIGFTVIALIGGPLWPRRAEDLAALGRMVVLAAPIQVITATIQASQPDIFLNLLPNAVAGEGLIAAYLEGNTAASISAAQYAQAVHQEYAKTKPYVTPLPDASQPQYALHDSEAPAPPVRSNLVANALNDADVLVQQLEYLLAGVGALMLMLRRRAPLVARQYGVCSLASGLLLVVIRLSGTIAAAYSGERAILQLMAVLAIAACWPLAPVSVRRRRLQGGIILAVAASLAVIFASGSGLADAALGGGTATNLSDSGEDYERFAMTTPEVAAAHWLGGQVQPGQLVYADQYAQLPLIAMTGIGNGLLLDVTPMTIDQHAWVYASTTNVVDGRARAEFDDDDVVYVFPSLFLRDNFDLVYTDGSSEVFHR